MHTFIAFLRGINVSGKKTVPMDELKGLFIGMGYQDVGTYINSGNVMFRASKGAASSIAGALERRIEEVFGFKVKVFVLGIHDLGKVISRCPFDEQSLSPNEKIYVTFLAQSPGRKVLDEYRQHSDETDESVVSGKVIYVLTRRGYSNTLFNNGFIEKILKTEATTRNLHTLRKVEDIANRLD